MNTSPLKTPRSQRLRAIAIYSSMLALLCGSSIQAQANRGTKADTNAKELHCRQNVQKYMHTCATQCNGISEKCMASIASRLATHTNTTRANTTSKMHISMIEARMNCSQQRMICVKSCHARIAQEILLCRNTCHNKCIEMVARKRFKSLAACKVEACDKAQVQAKKGP